MQPFRYTPTSQSGCGSALSAAMPPGTIAFNAATRTAVGALYSESGAIKRGISPSGTTVSTAGTTDYINFGRVSKARAGKHTVIVRLIPGTAYCALFGTINTGTTYLEQALLNTDTSGTASPGSGRVLFTVRDESGAIRTAVTGTGVITSGVEATLAFQFVSSSIISISVNGVPTSVTYALTGAPNPAAGITEYPFDLLNVNARGVHSSGSSQTKVSVFARIPSGSVDVKSLSNNPWQIFAAPASPIFVGFDAAGGTTDNLTAQSISTSAPTITQASVGQTHALSGQPTETAAPTVSAPALGQIHALSSQSISTSAPEIATPTLTSASTVDNLIAQALSTGQITITQAALAQIHVLAAQSLSTSAPTISTPAITAAANFDNLTAQDIVAGVPTISTPGVTQIHFLPAQSISTSAPTVTNAVLGSAGLAVWPTPDQVLAGTPYGPTGADYTGTAIAGSYPTAADIAAAVRAEMAAELARIDATISSRSTVAAIMGATAP